MNEFKSAKYVEWALKGVLYLTLLTPLLLYSRFIFPFITTKTMFFRLAIELAVLLYVVLIMLAPKFKPKMTKLSWAVVIFGIIILITGITGVDFYKTFWGSIERGEGFLTISHLIVYFLLLTWVFKSKKEWLNYLSVLVGVGLLVDLYGILQRNGVENFFLYGLFGNSRIIHAGQARVSATIGNPAFLGAFALAQFFLSLFLFLKRKHIVWKIVFAIAILVNFYIMYHAQTRGALLAWLAVIILLSIFYAVKSPSQIKKRVAIGILIVVIAGALSVWLNKNADWVRNNTTLRRLTKISRTDITTESRLLAADTSWKGWKDRFILGYGWENYNIAFNKYFHAEIYKDAGSQLWFDRAHNTIFDVAVATGIFGLINYLIIFGLALYYLFKNLKKDFDFSAVLIALLLAHFAQNIFVFDVLVTYIVLFTVLALIIANKFIKKENTIIHQAQEFVEDKLEKKPGFNILIFTPALIAIIFMAYAFNIKPLQANMTGVKALIAAGSNQEKMAIDFFIEAIDMKTYQTPELRHKLGDNIITYNKKSYGLTDDEIIANFDTAIEIMQDNIREHPLDVQNVLYLMAILNKAGKYDSQHYDEVIRLSKQALELSPTRPQIYFEMGQARINQKQFEEGIGYFKKGVELNPNTLDSHWNLMAAYILAGQDDNVRATQELMASKGYDFNTVDNLNRIYNVYLAAKNTNMLIVILEKIAQIQPSGDNYAKLAAAYKEMGLYAKAKMAVEKAVELNPALAPEAEKFLELMGY